MDPRGPDQGLHSEGHFGQAPRRYHYRAYGLYANPDFYSMSDIFYENCFYQHFDSRN